MTSTKYPTKLILMINRKSFFVAIIVGTIALSSCSFGGGDTYTGSATTDQGLTVQATGTVKVIPDGVSFNFSVNSIADTTELALSLASEAAASIRSALDDAGVDKDDIATQNVTIYPEYIYAQDGTQTLKGYRGSQSFVVTLRDTKEAGSVVDAVVKAGGNAVQISSVSPVLLDTDAAAQSARELAVKQARDKAKAYAKLFDVDLGDLIFVNEISAPITFERFMPQERTMDAGLNAKTEIDLGLQEVSVTVEVRWSLG